MRCDPTAGRLFDGSLAHTTLPPAVASASYNADNQLTQWGGTAMTYDPDGSLTSDGAHTYTWSPRNLLASVDGGNTASFVYDPFGRRVSKTVYGNTTAYLYDGSNVVQELSGSNPSANLLTGGLDEIFTRTDSTGTYSFLRDGLGSTLALTDSTGAVQQTYTYGPYGYTSTSGNTTSNSYQYIGREMDATGLYYFRARFYNPNTGRFLSEDPIGFAGSGPNLYAYVDDDPLDFIDPFGFDKKRSDCAWKTFKKNGLADILDVTTDIVDVAQPESQYVRLAWGLGLSTATMINSAANQDLTGTGLGMASYLKTPIDLGATSAGWGLAKWIPYATAVMDVYSTYHDFSQTFSDYNECMAN